MKNNVSARLNLLHKIANDSMVKVAFDTRRIDQNTQYNPRRNLQYYHREQSFIPDQDTIKIEALSKLKLVSDGIKNDFMGEPEWFDSYASDLDHLLEKTFFKSDGKNFDFSPAQTQYIEQVLDNRYHLKLADIHAMNQADLKNCIIHKDEHLEKSNIYKAGDLSKINKRKIETVSSQDGILHLVEGIMSHEKQLEELRLDQLSIQNRIARKQGDLQDLREDKNKIQRVVLEKSAAEKVLVRQLWEDHNSLQAVLDSKKSLEKLSSINGSYQFDNLKLFASLSQDITTFTNNMIKTRPFYDAINLERTLAEASLNEKIAMETKIAEEITELQNQLKTIEDNSLAMKQKMKEGQHKIAQLKSHEHTL